MKVVLGPFWRSPPGVSCGRKSAFAPCAQRPSAPKPAAAKRTSSGLHQRPIPAAVARGQGLYVPVADSARLHGKGGTPGPDPPGPIGKCYTTNAPSKSRPSDLEWPPRKGMPKFHTDRQQIKTRRRTCCHESATVNRGEYKILTW